MAEAETLTATERIRSAEETIAKARKALDRAESGLHAAGDLAEKADEAKSHPVLTTLAVLLTLGIAVAIAAAIRNS